MVIPALVLTLAGAEALAHDIQVPLATLTQEVQRLDRALALYRARPPVPMPPSTPAEQRRVLGAAEIELALGNRARALQLLFGRIEDPEFHPLPEYVQALLLASQILEQSGEHLGAMDLAERALGQGGTPEEMAEAGARWFRVARRAERLERRVDVYELWRRQGGERASGSEVAAEVAYEVAFALKADGRRADARALLARVASESAMGSRAAYLAGVLFVEDGDLGNAERWFAAVMSWPRPALEEGHPRIAIEREVRELAALSAGRLRYERGDLEGAEEAYRLVGAGARAEVEACWERAYLALERGRQRAALKHVQCVLDLGASGARHVDARLFAASLLAHLSRYGDSVESYHQLHASLEAERTRYAAALGEVGAPARLLFEGMERSVLRRGRDGTPGPATLFGDAWTAEVDRAYRVDRGLHHAEDDLERLAREVASLAELLGRDEAFSGLELQRTSLEQLLREIRHLEGHAGELERSAAKGHASSRPVPGADGHEGEAAAVRALIDRLRLLAREVERELGALDRLEAERRREALALLEGLTAELAGIRRDAASLKGEAAEPVNAVAQAALEEVEERIADAAMRAESGILDTYWLKKEHRTRAIERYLDLKKQTARQIEETVEELEAELGSEQAGEEE